MNTLITNKTYLIHELTRYNSVEYDGTVYWYKDSLGVDRKTICLATTNPKEYCNGTYLYSTKDDGSGKVFEVIAQSKQVLDGIPVISNTIDVDALADYKFNNTKFSSEAFRDLAIMDFKKGYMSANPSEFRWSDEDVTDMLIEFATLYHKLEYKDVGNDASEYLADKVRSIKSITVDENFRTINVEL